MSRPARYAKGLAKREEILTTALEVIARTGYRGTSVRELAAAVGLSQAGLLHYFSSKEELFAEILRKRDAVDHARASAEEGEAGSSVEMLIDIVRHNAEVPGLVQLYAQYSVEAAHPDHPEHAAFTERYDRIRGLLVADLAARQAAGTLDPGLDAAKLATVLIATCDGLQTQWLLNPDTDMAGHLAYLVDLLGLGRS